MYFEILFPIWLLFLFSAITHLAIRLNKYVLDVYTFSAQRVTQGWVHQDARLPIAHSLVGKTAGRAATYKARRGVTWALLDVHSAVVFPRRERLHSVCQGQGVR